MTVNAGKKPRLEGSRQEGEVSVVRECGGQVEKWFVCTVHVFAVLLFARKDNCACRSCKLARADRVLVQS